MRLPATLNTKHRGMKEKCSELQSAPRFIREVSMGSGKAQCDCIELCCFNINCDKDYNKMVKNLLVPGGLGFIGSHTIIQIF